MARTFGGASVSTLAVGSTTSLTGSVNGSRSYSQSDTVTGSSSSVQSSSSYNVQARPSAGPPASPSDTDKKTLYANRVAKASYAAIDATGGIDLTFGSLSDVLCASGACAKVNHVLIQNIGAEVLDVTWTDLSTAAIKIPAYGELQIIVPMDGITLAGTKIHFQCGAASKTTDAVVVLSYQV